MNILLCTPFHINSQVIQGGIAIWAQNIVDYYHTVVSDVQLHIIPYDRKTDAKACKSMLKRVWLGYLDYRDAIKETRRQLNSGSYDALHLCTSASISLIKDILVLKLARRKRVKGIIHFHFGRIPAVKHKNNWEWWLLKRVVSLSNSAIVMDLKSLSALKDSGFHNVLYLPNPLSNSISEQIAKEAGIINRENNRICFVGHVIPTKGVYELVKACQSITGIKLCVVGKVADDVRNKMEQLSGGGDWIIFKGEVSHAEVIKELLAAEVFAFPSHTEGFPNVILESMACGCAITTTPVGAIPEMLSFDSVVPCGLCSEVNDVEGLRNNILFLLNNKKDAREYAKRAQKRVSQLYSIPIIWMQLEQIWHLIH
jgi:glycosyltransferase involved in cell wall biosynthesis